jgi:hypothetical protein
LAGDAGGLNASSGHSPVYGACGMAPGARAGGGGSGQP